MLRTIVRTYRSAYSGLSRDLWLLSFVLLVNRAGAMVLPFISLYLTQERGYPVAVAGRVLAMYGLGALVVGGVGAALVKSGLFARFWKPIAVALAALGAGVKRFFFGARSADHDPEKPIV